MRNNLTLLKPSLGCFMLLLTGAQCGSLSNMNQDSNRNSSVPSDKESETTQNVSSGPDEVTVITITLANFNKHFPLHDWKTIIKREAVEGYTKSKHCKMSYPKDVQAILDSQSPEQCDFEKLECYKTLPPEVKDILDNPEVNVVDKKNALRNYWEEKIQGSVGRYLDILHNPQDYFNNTEGKDLKTVKTLYITYRHAMEITDDIFAEALRNYAKPKNYTVRFHKEWYSYGRKFESLIEALEIKEIEKNKNLGS